MMVLHSFKNDSGNPAALPTQSRAAKFCTVLGVVESGEVEVPIPGVLGVLKAAAAKVDSEPVGGSIGKTFGSVIFPLIHFCTSPIYCAAGTLIGSRFWFNQV